LVATVATGQPYSRSALPTPHEEGARKGASNIARYTHSHLVNRDQRCHYNAVGTRRTKKLIFGTLFSNGATLWNVIVMSKYDFLYVAHTHTHTFHGPLGLCPGLPG